ncbi:MAG TPA: putative quinol monooxygenase [Stellaceae bacterium]|nr:putative quinol monooxygenase [Stellaceae bacterium]
MELFIFARFHAREGKEADLAAVLGTQVPFTRTEPGCLMIEAYRSTRDPRLFFIYSRWTDEAAFEAHAELANTVEFIARVEALIDHPLDVTRSRPLG